MKIKEVIISDEFSLSKFYHNLRFYKYSHKIFKLKFKGYVTKEIKEELHDIVCILNEKSKKERLKLIFDLVCIHIDKHYPNICEFENNQCYVQKTKDKSNGCCGKCRYLIEGHCSQPSVACKLYYCIGIRKKKKCPTIYNLKLIKYFLTPKEKLVFTMSLYKNKEETFKDARKNIFFYLLTPTKNNK